MPADVRTNFSQVGSHRAAFSATGAGRCPYSGGDVNARDVEMHFPSGAFALSILAALGPGVFVFGDGVDVQNAPFGNPLNGFRWRMLNA